MLLMTASTDIIRVVTSAAASITCHASWVDNVSGTITPGRTNTAAIVTATTTTIVAGPSSGQRNVKSIHITNNHATISSQVTVQHFDNTNSDDLMGVTLLPGENLIFGEDGCWKHHDAQGGEYAYGNTVADAFSSAFGITNTIAETMPRNLCPEVNSVIGTTGQLFCQAVYLKAGQKVTNISFCSATTAAGTPTHYAFGLYSTTGSLLASSADQTSTAWAANTLKTLAMGTPYTVLTTGLYYIALSVVATTVPTIKGGTALTDGTLRNTTPALQGITSTTYATGTLPASISVPLTKGTVNIWGAVT